MEQAAASMDDIALVKACLAGDGAALERLCALHAGVVQAFGLRLGFDAPDAELLREEVLFHVSKSLESFDPAQESFDDWLEAAATNAARKTPGRRGRTHDADLAHDVFTAHACLARDARCQEQFLVIGDCVHRLPPDLGTLVRLRYVEGMTLAAMGRQASMSKSAIRARLCEAHAWLQLKLESLGVLSRGGHSSPGPKGGDGLGPSPQANQDDPMSAKNEPSDPRLDPLLRNWGAHEAAEKNRPASTAVTVAASRGRQNRSLSRRLRDGLVPGTYLCRAAVLVAAACAILAVTQYAGRRQADRDLAAQRVRFDSNLAALHESLQQSQTQLAAARSELESRRQTATTQQAAQGDLESRLQAATTQLTAAESKAAASESALKQAQADAQQQAAALEAAKAQLAEQGLKVEEAARKVSSATEELAQGQKTCDQATAEAAKAREAQQQAQARIASQWEDFRGVYAAALAPGEKGLHALQTASRKARLVEQCVSLRATAQEPAKGILEKAETVLTRLDMVDTNSPEAGDSFAALLHKLDLGKQVDQSLEGAAAGELRDWLLQFKLVLAGAEHAK